MGGTVVRGRYRLKRNEVNVSDEGHKLFDEYRAAGKGIYNGIINDLLHQKYGDRVRHVLGFGWVLTEEES